MWENPRAWIRSLKSKSLGLQTGMYVTHSFFLSFKRNVIFFVFIFFTSASFGKTYQSCTTPVQFISYSVLCFCLHVIMKSLHPWTFFLSKKEILKNKIKSLFVHSKLCFLSNLFFSCKKSWWILLDFPLLSVFLSFNAAFLIWKKKSSHFYVKAN